MRVIERWNVHGKYYQRTCEAWPERMTQNRSEVLDVFAATYGRSNARRHFCYWRVFFMACAELCGYRNGSEWFVAHRLLVPLS